ncbi:hypothetical protein AX23_17180 [Brucella melitensis 548]|nr:hypothetical protein AX23_17180 [Brucella melitensis 548]
MEGTQNSLVRPALRTLFCHLTSLLQGQDEFDSSGGEMRMAVIGDVLFMRSDGGDVGDVVRHVERELANHVDGYDQHRFDSQTDEDVVRALVRELSIEPITLDYDGAQKNVVETRISVRDHFEGTVEVPGLRLSKTFPFTGDEGLWKWGAGQWSSMMPRGEVYGGSVTIGMAVRENEGEAAANHINSTLEQIEEYLARQKAQLDPFNAALPGLLLPLVKARRDRRNSAQDLLDKF